jgi:competence protein ComEC
VGGYVFCILKKIHYLMSKIDLLRVTQLDDMPEVCGESEVVYNKVLYQPFSLLLMASILGILADKFICVSPKFWLIVAVFSFFVSLIFHCRNNVIFSTVFLFLFCFCLFGFWHYERWNCFPSDDLGFYAIEGGYPVGVRVLVSELPRLVPASADNFIEDEPRTIFTVRAQEIRDGRDWKKVSGNVLVTINGDCTKLNPGNEVVIFGELSKPVKPKNPDDIDIAANLRSQRILCVIHCKSPDAVVFISSGKGSVTKALGIIRRWASENLLAATSSETALLASAMLLGLRDGVDEQTRQNLIDTGTMHILAISGLHVAVVAICFRFLFLLFGLSNRVTAVLTVLIVVQYLFITNMAPPAIRATVLVMVISVATFTGRRAYGVNSFCATALFTLILNPSELFQFGAQLSYIATAAFFWIPDSGVVTGLFSKFILRNDNSVRVSELALIERVNWDNSILYNLLIRIFNGVRKLFITGVVIWLITTPLVLERIHVFAPVSVLVNPFIWLPLYCAMASGFITMVFGSVPFVGFYLGVVSDISFGALFWVISFFQWLGGHYWSFSFPAWWSVIFYSCFIFVTIMPFCRPSNFILFWSILFWVLVGFCSFWVSDIYRYYLGEMRVDIFAVGHGNCVLITTPSKGLIVYDVGCITSSRRVVDILSRRVWRLGCRRIDAVIISHPDSDHFNGLEKLVERFEVGAVLVSPYMFLQPTDKKNEQNFKKTMRLRELLWGRNIPVIEVGAGDDLFDYGLLESKILHPPKDAGVKFGSNESSLVLWFRHFGASILLPADLDGLSGVRFLSEPSMDCDVMMIPHHGGKSDVTESLLRWATPELLIISDGDFTHRAVSVEGYRRRNFTVHSTRDSGFIEIKINKHSRNF